jgi:hypothetical protein
MTPLVDLRRPGRFLLAFAATTAALLAVWQLVAGYYLAALVWATNQVLAASGGSLGLRLPPNSGEVAYPVMAGAVALFAVTPGRTVAWKLKWLAGLTAGLFLLHGFLLCEELRAALGGVAVDGAAGASHAGLGHLFRTNLTLVAVALTWFVAVRRPPAGRRAARA